MKKYNEEFQIFEYTLDDIIKKIRKYKDILNLNYKFENNYITDSEWSYQWRINNKVALYLFKHMDDDDYGILFNDYGFFSKDAVNRLYKGFNDLRPTFKQTMTGEEAIDFIDRCGLILHDSKIIVDTRKRKLNLEVDPFGEENWGHVQESKLLKFEQFKYVPDKEVMDKEMLKRTKSPIQIKDGSGIFYQKEKEFLESAGFEIKNNPIGYVNIKFSYANKNILNSEFAEVVFNGYTILIFKDVPKGYDIIYYKSAIIENKTDYVKKEFYECSLVDYDVYEEDMLSDRRKRALKLCLDRIYFELYDIGVMKYDGKKIDFSDVDPFGEEKW